MKPKFNSGQFFIRRHHELANGEVIITPAGVLGVNTPESGRHWNEFVIGTSHFPYYEVEPDLHGKLNEAFGFEPLSHLQVREKLQELVHGYKRAKQNEQAEPGTENQPPMK